MYIVMNRIPVKREYQQEFEERFKRRQGLVDQSPGFIRNLVLRPSDDSSEYHIVLTMWRDRQAFLDWTESDAFRQAHAQARETPRDMFTGQSKLETFELVSDSDTDRA